jgi:hypothetical protein
MALSELATASNSDGLVNFIIISSALAGVAFALWLWHRVSKIHVGGGGALRAENGREYLLEEEQRGENEVSRCSVAGFGVIFTDNLQTTGDILLKPPPILSAD